MSEAVVILPPDQRSDEDVDGRHRRAPVEFFLRFLQPFGVLVEHRIDHVHEGFVGGEEAVAAGENVAFEPAFKRVLAEHLHDASRDVELAAVGIFRLVFGKPCLLRSGVDRREPVGGCFVRAKDPEAAHVAAHDFREKMGENVGWRSIASHPAPSI